MFRDETEITQIKKQIKAFEGKKVIYDEGIAHGKAEITKISYDDWGVKIKLHSIDKNTNLPLNWEISAAWEIFYFTTTEWTGSYLSWHIYFEEF